MNFMTLWNSLKASLLVMGSVASRHKTRGHPLFPGKGTSLADRRAYVSRLAIQTMTMQMDGHFQPSHPHGKVRTRMGIVVLTGRASDLEAFSPYLTRVASQHCLVKQLHVPEAGSTSSSRTTVDYHHNDTKIVKAVYLLSISTGARARKSSLAQ